MQRSTMDIVVAGLGAALVVFFAGAAAAIATGHTPPTELWAAGGAVSGGLIGLLVPSPLADPVQGGAAEHHAAAAEQYEAAAQQHEATATQRQAAGQDAAPHQEAAAQQHEAAAQEHTQAAQAAAQPVQPSAGQQTTMWLLLGVFVVLLVVGFLLASGHVLPPKGFVKQLEGLTNAIIALASAAGSALIGLLAPSPSQAGSHK